MRTHWLRYWRYVQRRSPLSSSTLSRSSGCAARASICAPKLSGVSKKLSGSDVTKLLLVGLMEKRFLADFPRSFPA